MSGYLGTLPSSTANSSDMYSNLNGYTTASATDSSSPWLDALHRRSLKNHAFFQDSKEKMTENFTKVDYTSDQAGF